MRANEIHLERARLLVKTSKATLALVLLRAVIAATGDLKGRHEIIYSIHSLTDLSGTQFLLMERLHDCVGDCLANPTPEISEDIPQRAWAFDTYNQAAYIMGVEWLLSSRADLA
jgi:hypothetical protein